MLENKIISVFKHGLFFKKFIDFENAFSTPKVVYDGWRGTIWSMRWFDFLLSSRQQVIYIESMVKCFS